MSISQRGAARLSSSKSSPYPSPSGPYYDPELHPQGVINLSTAENSLLSHKILPILNEQSIKSQHLRYRVTLLRSSTPQLADLLPTYVNYRKPVRPVTRANSVAGPGVGSLLAQLFWAICEPGEGVLLSAPYYHDYERDIVFPAEAKTVLAHVPAHVDPLSPDVIPILKQRIQSSNAEGVPIRCLLLCNPHNPIPRCYPRETIEGYIALAQQFNLHLVVDEVFAYTTLSTDSNPHPTPFISVLSLPIWQDPTAAFLQRLHVLAGPTKDLGCSGLKAGLLVTENADVRTLVERGLLPTPISGATEAALTGLLLDEERLTILLEENRRQCAEAMGLCSRWATYHDLPIVEANAGVYFILDLSPVVTNLGLEQGGLEEVSITSQLMRRMITNKVYINPLALDADPQKYRFRFIYTHVQDTLKLALRRLEAAFGLGSFPEVAES
ncbi:pyridoxal phosphate-dependent transferase [Naematelia encephala]|uniref:Pyridoxal phosphate-dependent transferase n=1 Tax=Naematelia encephala TaxID=71784 RepID=A0A1Y2AWN0_9TREE|nr:pyridoxal phosphate-dependent transferase [Naematelia encephala]